jgi:hypothetical protein
MDIRLCQRKKVCLDKNQNVQGMFHNSTSGKVPEFISLCVKEFCEVAQAITVSVLNNNEHLLKLTYSGNRLV